MKSVLLGNGINIEFGGKAYSNDFIMKRIKYRALLGDYDFLFNNQITGKDILGVLNRLVEVANDIKIGNYDTYATHEIAESLTDFKKRYTQFLTESHEIMLEDWFFVLHMFFLKEKDLVDKYPNVIQGFEEMCLDGIYNDGRIQQLYTIMPKEVKKFFHEFDNIFTLNYDDNIERLTSKNVNHLHGDFSVLAHSENEDYVMGYIRKLEGKQVVVKGMEHCFCNALLNYSGKLKYKTAKQYHENNVKMDKIIQDNCMNEQSSQNYLTYFKQQKGDSEEYRIFETKVIHPELKCLPEYHFDEFESIADELSIIGMSPNNDGHIFNCILNNKKLTKVYFYYFTESEKKFIQEHYDNSLFECKSVTELWAKKGSKHKKYNCKVTVPNEIDKFIDCFNSMSGDTVSKEKVIAEVEQTPQYERSRLCGLVNNYMDTHGGHDTPKNETDLMNKLYSISPIALREGILPSALYMIYVIRH